ncbi:MAG: AMP-binding protein [Methanomassiliicoccales archaeon]|nr:AMP-binding protein [Methanomassiliicoccales archaeon]
MNPFKRLTIALARTRLSSTKIDKGSRHPLEDWILSRVAAEARASKGLRQVIGTPRPEEVDRQMLREYQLHMFRKQMRYTGENSPFYQRRWKETGLRPEDIRSYDDLCKVPVTEPKDLAESPFEFLCVSQTKVMRAFTTSGTSGMRKRMFYTRNDILNTIDPIAAALKNVGMRQNDTLQIMFPTVAAWDPGLMLEGACKVAGLKAVNCSSINVEEQLRLMRENRTTMMIGLTSFIHRLTLLAREKHDLRSFGIKALILSAEPLPQVMRRELEEAWGCKALSQYGMTEMGLATTIECQAQDGLHINEAGFLAEVIDPATGEHVGNRKEGELVWTSLMFEGSPLLRYRANDITSPIEPPCGCGFQAVGKIGAIRGRTDMQTKVGFGEKVFPLLFDEAVLGVRGVLGYHLIIEKEGYKDRLRFQVEYIGDANEGRRSIEDALHSLDEIKSGFENDLLAPVEVEIQPPDQEGWVPKTRTIVDNRKQYG